MTKLKFRERNIFDEHDHGHKEDDHDDHAKEDDLMITIMIKKIIKKTIMMITIMTRSQKDDHDDHGHEVIHTVSSTLTFG